MTERAIHRKLQQATGLDLTTAAVADAIRKRMKQRHLHDRSAYVCEAIDNKDELGALIDQVVVPETWFFRIPEAFSAATRFALDLYARERRPVRILSVPCAGGEEPYSLAISLLSAEAPPNSFFIDAVDVSPQAIARARQAVYKRNAFRTADLTFRDRYFIPRDGGFVLDPTVRNLAHFRRGNLMTLEPLDEKAYDIIFCRNLLIYFSEAVQEAAIRKLHALLQDDGLLFCGYAEITTFCLHDFTRAPHSQAFAVHKRHRDVMNKRPAGVPFIARPVQTSLEIGEVSQLPKPLIAPSSPVHSHHAEPPHADFLLKNARRLADQGAIDEADKTYRAYLELVPDSGHAHFMLGLLSEQRGDDKSALEFLRRAIYLDPNHYEALCHLSLLAERQGNNTGACNYRQRAGRVFERRTGEYKQ